MVKQPARRDVLIGGASALLLGGQSRSRREKIALWDNATGPHLRGAVIPQRRVYPEIDGEYFLGPGPVGAPISNASLEQLAATGANLVVLSCPGVFEESAPFRPDAQIIDWLGNMIDRCTARGLFTVIGFRTGPGRSEFTFHPDGADDWFPGSMIDERIWQTAEMQEAWAEMCRYAARQFGSERGVAGLAPMIEPNASHIAPEFDWPRFALRLSRAIRAADSDVPILISPNGYSNRTFAGALDLTSVSNAVLFLHDYAPYEVTHAAADQQVSFAREDAVFDPPHAPRWAMGEFGIQRWVPQAERYLDLRLASLESAGANSAVFHWPTGWRDYERVENAWNPLLGPDFTNSERLPTTAVLDVLRRYWSRNSIRP